MASVHRRISYRGNDSDATDQAVFEQRRTILRSAGFLGAAALAQPVLRALGGDSDEGLGETIRPVPGSAFRACGRNGKFKVVRPMTEELVAAKYNNFYEFGLDKDRCWREAQKLTTRPWQIEIGGLVKKPVTIDIDDLIRKMPCEERVYRFRCVERWAMVVPWSGFQFSHLMKLVEPLASAKFVRFVSFLRPEEAVGQVKGSPWPWPYYEALRIAEAANELCFAATGLYGHDIPKQHGAPLRMVLPWKYGYKGAKSVVKIEFVADEPATFWNDVAPTEYGFYSNVNPQKPHPRWSQAKETMIGTNVSHDTMLYNGYGEFVAGLYNGKEF